MDNKLKKIDRILALDKDPKMVLFNLIESTEKKQTELEEMIKELKSDTRDDIKELRTTILPVAEAKQGIKGEKGDSVDENEIASIVMGNINVPKDGKNGKDGEKGKIGPTGRTGSQGDRGIMGVQGVKGEQGLEGIPGNPGITPKHEWKGTAVRFQEPDGAWGEWKNLMGMQGDRGYKGGGGNLETFIGSEKVGSSQRLYFKAGTGVTLSSSDEAGGTGITINSSATTNFADDEVPTGTVNSINKIFTILHTPVAGSLKVFVNGQRMKLVEDYTFSGTTITFITAPPTGSILITDYRYV